jgi:hypothetical protein
MGFRHSNTDVEQTIKIYTVFFHLKKGGRKSSGRDGNTSVGFFIIQIHSVLEFWLCIFCLGATVIVVQKYTE